MDWTSKAPSHWEWEALFPFNEKEAEISKLAQQPELKFDHTNNSYMIGSESGGDACSSIDYGNGSSRSSISVSIGSPSKASPSKASPSHAVAITRVFNFESVDQSPQDLNKNRDLANLEAAILDEAAVSIAPTEQLIGLKLGKRTYFEDICGATSIANTSLASTNSLTGLVKKVKVPQQNMQSSCCQVEGCNIDLTSAKDYHRKHRVCETHSKSPRVIVAGQERRFCQQCSRFHGLSEFDQKKRSCRRRLSDHNARRRKPQPETMSFSSSIFPASYFDVKQPASLSFGRAPFNQLINIGSSPWNDSGGFKLVPAKESRVKSSKLESINRHLHLPSIEMPKNISTVSHDLDWLLPFKGVAAKVVDNKGLGAPVAVSFSDGASDLRRALSLLSSEVWASPDLEPVSDFQFANENTIGTHSANHPSNAAISVWQQDELPLPKALPFNLQTSDAHFQELQLHKATPCKTTFFDSTRIH